MEKKYFDGLRMKSLILTEKETENGEKIENCVREVLISPGLIRHCVRDGVEENEMEFLSFERNCIQFRNLIENFIQKRTKKLRIILHGAPGNGKTFFINKMLRDILKNHHDKELRILKFNYCDIVTSGGNFSKLRKILEFAMKTENSIIFFDEGFDYTGLEKDSNFPNLKKMFIEDGFLEKYENPFIVATNEPWDLDPYIIHNFEYKILFDELNFRERKRLITSLLRKSKVRYVLSDKEMDEIVKKMEYFTCADIREFYRRCIFSFSKKLNFVYFFHKLIEREVIMKFNGVGKFLKVQIDGKECLKPIFNDTELDVFIYNEEDIVVLSEEDFLRTKFENFAYDSFGFYDFFEVIDTSRKSCSKEYFEKYRKFQETFGKRKTKFVKHFHDCVIYTLRKK